MIQALATVGLPDRSRVVVETEHKGYATTSGAGSLLGMLPFPDLSPHRRS